MLAALDLAEAVATVEADRRVSFATEDGLRFANRDALFPLFESAIGARGHSDLVAASDAGGVIHSRYATMLDAANDPTMVLKHPVFGRADNPSGFGYPAAGCFATVPQLDRHAPQSAPRNGEHSEQVLAERLGLASGTIAALVDQKIVGTAG